MSAFINRRSDVDESLCLCWLTCPAVIRWSFMNRQQSCYPQTLRTTSLLSFMEKNDCLHYLKIMSDRFWWKIILSCENSLQTETASGSLAQKTCCCSAVWENDDLTLKFKLTVGQSAARGLFTKTEDSGASWESSTATAADKNPWDVYRWR